MEKSPPCKWKPQSRGSVVMAWWWFTHTMMAQRCDKNMFDALASYCISLEEKKLISINLASTHMEWNDQFQWWQHCALPRIAVGVLWHKQCKWMPLASRKTAFGSSQCHKAISHLAASCNWHPLIQGKKVAIQKALGSRKAISGRQYHEAILHPAPCRELQRANLATKKPLVVAKLSVVAQCHKETRDITPCTSCTWHPSTPSARRTCLQHQWLRCSRK